MGEVLAGIVLGPDRRSARSRRTLETALFPSDIIPFIGVVAQLGLIFYMFLVGLEVDLEPAQGARRPGGRHLERERGAPDAARHRRGAADLRAGRPGQEVRRLRALHGRLDVDHRVPGARAHPRRAADAQAAGRRARARLRGDRRRDGLVPDRARDRGRGRGLGHRGRWRRSRWPSSSRRHGLRDPAAPGAGLDGVRRGRARARAAGSSRSSRASCCRPTRRRRSASR